MRTRTKGTIAITTLKTDTNKDCGTPSTTVTSSPPLFATGETWSCVDRVTSGFEEISKRGGIINNPCVITRESRVLHKTSLFRATRIAACGSGPEVRETNFYGSSSTAYPGFSKPTTEQINSVGMTAYTQAVANSAKADWQSLVDLAEAHRVYDEAGSIFFELRDIYEDAARKAKHHNERIKTKLENASHNPGGYIVPTGGGTREGPRALPSKTHHGTYNNAAEFISANWLRYRYAVMPLFYSASAIVKLANERNSLPRQTYRGAFQDSWSGNTPATLAQTGTYGKTYLATQSSWTIKARASTLVEAQLEMLAKLGMQTTDLPSTAWELVPFSFVADWFVNFGEFISALTLRPGVRTLASCYTTKVTSIVDWQYYTVGTNGAFSYIGDGACEGQGVSFTYQRVTDPSIGISFRITEYSPTNARRLADVVAFTTILLSRKLTSLSKAGTREGPPVGHTW